MFNSRQAFAEEIIVPLTISYDVIKTISIEDTYTDEFDELYFLYEEEKEYEATVSLNSSFYNVTIQVNGDPVFIIDEIIENELYSFYFSFSEEPTEVYIEAYGEINEPTEKDKDAVQESIITSLKEIKNELNYLKNKLESESFILETYKTKEDKIDDNPLTVISKNYYVKDYDKELNELRNEQLDLEENIETLNVKLDEVLSKLNEQKEVDNDHKDRKDISWIYAVTGFVIAYILLGFRRK